MSNKSTAAPSDQLVTEAQVRAKLGENGTVVGTYELREILNKKGDPWRNWPVVLLDNGKFIALESVWDESKQPPAEEVARWRGKRVAVTGMLLGQPPSTNPANMSLLTVSPVEAIQLAE